MIRDLKEFKDKLIQKYYISYSKNRIVETTQRIIDLICKRIKRKVYIKSDNTKQYKKRKITIKQWKIQTKMEIKSK